MKPGILRNGCITQPAQIEHLVLGGEAATLRVVVARDALLKDRLRFHVVVQVMDDAVTVLLEPQRRAGVEEMRLSGEKR